MTQLTTKRLSQLSVSLLTAGALLLPAVSMANPVTTQASAEVTTQTAVEPKLPDEARSIKSMFRTLNITDDQKAQINPLVEEKKQAFTEIHQQMQENRKALNDVTLAQSFDAEKAKQLANKQGELVGKLALIRAETTSKIYHILTPEQQEKFRALQAERMKKPHKP